MVNDDTLLCNESGDAITCFHGTYYDFDYFFPLTHFGSEASARTVLKEGKWKRDKNIDINNPKIIPVHFRKGFYLEGVRESKRRIFLELPVAYVVIPVAGVVEAREEEQVGCNIL